MKTQANFKRSIIGVGVVTALILLVPLVAIQFSEEVDWKLPDFIIMGALIYGTGISYMWITRNAPNIAYRAATGLAILGGFLMIWANLAVGLIGSGPNVGNLMYLGVVVVGITGTIRSHFKAGGMARAMYAIVGALVILAVIASLANIPESSVSEIVGVNGFFAGVFLVSGVLFQLAGRETLPAVS